MHETPSPDCKQYDPNDLNIWSCLDPTILAQPRTHMNSNDFNHLGLTPQESFIDRHHHSAGNSALNLG